MFRNLMSANQESIVESDNDEEDEYSQDFEDDGLNDSDLLSVESSSSQDILSPPPIQRISDHQFEGIGLIQGEDGGDSSFEIPNIKEVKEATTEEKSQYYQEESEAMRFKKEFESFQATQTGIEDMRQHKSDGIESIIQSAVGDQTLRDVPATQERIAENIRHPTKVKFVVHHDEQKNKKERKPAPLRQRIRYSKARIEYLSRPRRRQLPEPMNTPTRVSTKSSWKDFIERQEYMENQRRMKQEHRRKERDYQDKIDKLKCPVCSTEQTFKEYIEFQTSCRCGAKYKKSTFRLRDFESRMFKSRIRKQNQIQKVLDEREKALVYGKYTKDKLRSASKAQGNDFLDRMKQDLLKRTRKIEKRKS